MTALRRDNFAFASVVTLATFDFFGLRIVAATTGFLNEKGRCLALLLELARDDYF